MFIWIVVFWTILILFFRIRWFLLFWSLIPFGRSFDFLFALHLRIRFQKIICWHTLWAILLRLFFDFIWFLFLSYWYFTGRPHLFSDLLFHLSNYFRYDFWICSVNGCHFGIHFLKKIEANFVESAVPIIIPIVILSRLSVFRIVVVLFLHTRVQLF